MNCSRCKGFMAKEHCLDMEASYTPMWTTNWRCVNCGHLRDCVTEKKSEVHHGNVPAVSGRERGYEHDDVPLGAEAFIRAVA